MSLKEPVFIIGTGRSGSTVFADLLRTHPEFSYMTTLSHRYPYNPNLNRQILNLMHLPVFGKYVETKFGLSEAYPFWDSLFRGFSQSTRELNSNDVTEKVRKSVIDGITSIMVPKRDKFISKITGWPRIGFLHEIFPDAKFVHIVRDGRDVACSLIQTTFWRGWQGPHNWRLGLLPEEYEAEWKRNDNSYVILAGIFWKIILDSIDNISSTLPTNQFIEIRYEDFVKDPTKYSDLIFQQLGMPLYTNKMEKISNLLAIKDRGNRWKKDLNSQQTKLITESLESDLVNRGYTI